MTMHTEAAEDIVTRTSAPWSATIRDGEVQLDVGTVSIILPRSEAAKLAHGILWAYGGNVVGTAPQ